MRAPRYVTEHSEVPIELDYSFFINCIKKLILKHWKSTQPPTLLHWKREMSYYLNMEKIAAMEKNKSTKFGGRITGTEYLARIFGGDMIFMYLVL